MHVTVTGLNATLLEKESELSRIQKDLKSLQPYMVRYLAIKLYNRQDFQSREGHTTVSCLAK